MKVTTLPDGTQLQYIKVGGLLEDRWISHADSLMTTNRPEHAKGFLPGEALALYHKLVSLGYKGLSLTNALPADLKVEGSNLPAVGEPVSAPAEESLASLNEQTSIINCYARVSGVASDEEDEGVQGFYLIEVLLDRKVSLDVLKVEEKSKIAKAVLDSFHDHQGIEVIDDFEIAVHLADGSVIAEEGEDLCGESGFQATYCGKVSESELEFSHEALIQENIPGAGSAAGA